MEEGEGSLRKEEDGIRDRIGNGVQTWARTIGDELNRRSPGSTAVLAITSADRLHRGWIQAQRVRRRGSRTCRAQIEKLLSAIGSSVRIVTITDGHPSVLTWLGAVAGHRVCGLGVDRYGESGTLTELYQAYRLDAQ